MEEVRDEVKKVASEVQNKVVAAAPSGSKLSTFLAIFFGITTVALLVVILVPVLKLRPYSEPLVAAYLIKAQFETVLDLGENFAQRTVSKAIRDSEADVVKSLVKKQGVKTNMFEFYGMTAPLHLAANSGDMEILKSVVEHTRVSKIDDQDARGFSALHWSVAKNWLEGTQYLLSFDAAVDAVASCSDNITPFHIATQAGMEMTQKLLNYSHKNRVALREDLEGASETTEEQWTKSLVNILTTDKQGPLYFALSRGNVDIARLLVKLGANPKIVTTDGKSIFYAATTSGNAEALQYAYELIKPTQKEMLWHPEGTDSPFINAFYMQCLDCVKWYADKGLASFEPGTRGRSATDIAIFSGWAAGLQILIDNGLDLTPQQRLDYADFAAEHAYDAISEKIALMGFARTNLKER